MPQQHLDMVPDERSACEPPEPMKTAVTGTKLDDDGSGADGAGLLF